MIATNLDLIGENKLGQMTRRHMYSDDSGAKYVKAPVFGTLRRQMVPYKKFASEYLTYSYIMERKSDWEVRHGR